MTQWRSNCSGRRTAAADGGEQQRRQWQLVTATVLWNLAHRKTATHRICLKAAEKMERREYEVAIEDGKLLYKQTGEYVDTTGSSTGSKWIFVLSTSRTLYVGVKKKGLFQHSIFLAGGATLAAGRLVSEKGVLKAIWPHSGHYRPTQENFQDFVSFLQDNDVDTTYVKTNSDEDDNESLNKQGVSLHVRTHSSEDDVSEKERLDTEDMPLVDHISKVTLVMKQITNLPLDSPKKSRLSRSSSRKLTTLDTKNHADDDATSAHDVSDDEDEPSLDKTVPKKSILKRIGSHKGTNSFQLGRQLSCKWSTGAGPRIGCLRDYPTEMQSHALEQANLSPESAPCSHKNINKSFFSRNCGPYRTSSSPSQMIF
ncbi:IQ domain-containing protein IQM2-like [Bidens hawaiensis]|uniref:IQ domain-containing protein IQM2-like n=1 Tax=Bidens hawaiensis TaxID=980011 RepID=UPI0040494FF7